MLIFTKIADLQGFLKGIRINNQTVGFVPTMGALHEGHLSLVAASREQCDVTICSVFVNPTQFNDKADLVNYPRMPEIDAGMLEKAHCDALFIPSTEEIYPNEETGKFDFGYLDKVLEGSHRPGHFNGVAQVVKRLFEIVQPDKAFFGSKDYQQVMIVKMLVKQMGSPIRVVSCPTLREPDGLAMSSRNMLLSQEERQVAALIPGMMQMARSIAGFEGIEAAKKFILQKVNEQPLMKLDYYEICDSESLKPLSALAPGDNAISLIAVFVGKVRLIDNLPV
jgi:pantoate--beta-alanine ligase